MRGEAGVWEDTNTSITSDKTAPTESTVLVKYHGGFHIESEALGCLCVGVYMFQDNTINNQCGRRGEVYAINESIKLFRR